MHHRTMWCWHHSKSSQITPSPNTWDWSTSSSFVRRQLSMRSAIIHFIVSLHSTTDASVTMLLPSASCHCHCLSLLHVHLVTALASVMHCCHYCPLLCQCHHKHLSPLILIAQSLSASVTVVTIVTNVTNVTSTTARRHLWFPSDVPPGSGQHGHTDSDSAGRKCRS